MHLSAMIFMFKVHKTLLRIYFAEYWMLSLVERDNGKKCVSSVCAGENEKTIELQLIKYAFYSCAITIYSIVLYATWA